MSIKLPDVSFSPAQSLKRGISFAVVLGVLGLLSACWDDDVQPSDPPQPVVQGTAVVDIELSNATATVNTAVTMKALARTQNTTIASYSWKLADGRTLQGPQVSASFGAAGKADVTLEAVTAEGAVITARAAVFVFDSQGTAQRALSLPVIPGDVDGQAGLSVLDALVVAQSVSGVQPMDSAASLDADFDLDARLSATDRDLLMQAVLNNAAMPSSLLSGRALPGTVVAMVSPALLDGDVRVSVQVDGVMTSPPMRATPGYASFIVPTTLTRNGDGLPVEVLVGNQVVERFTLSVRPLPAMPSDAAADVLQAVQDARALLQSQETVLRNQLSAAGVASADIAVAIAATQAGAAQLTKASSDLAALFNGPGGQALARLVQKSLYANGLQDLRDGVKTLSDVRPGDPRMRALALFTPDQVCDVMVPAVCGLKRTAEIAKTASDLFSAACSVTAAAVFIGGVIFPADGPAIEAGALAGFVKVCLPLATAAEIGSLAGSLFSAIDLKLKSSASPTALNSGQTATVRAAVAFLGLEPVCSEFAGKGMEAAATRILGRRIVGMLLTRNASVSKLAEVFAAVGDKPYVALLTAIQSSVANTLSASGLTDALGKVAGSVCPSVTGGEAAIPVSRVFAPIQASEGILTFNADGTGTYACPSPQAGAATGAVTLNGERRLCGDQVQKTSVAFSCASGSVTITMGDNGSALDDIFEVVIDGVTVLTSSTPVTSTSVSLTLPKGRTTVLMRGLAAPDGIGTYFIRFTGATVISGATSGSDLVPGVTKTFTIEVQ